MSQQIPEHSEFRMLVFFGDRYFTTAFNHSLWCSKHLGPARGVAYFLWELSACLSGSPSECEAGFCLVKVWHTNGDCGQK